MNKKQLEKNIDNMSWTYRVENFINNMTRQEAKDLLKFFKNDVAKIVNDFSKMISDKNTLYGTDIIKCIGDNIKIHFNIRNCNLEIKDWANEDSIQPVVCVTMNNKAKDDSISDRSDIVQFDTYFQVVCILLERYIKLSRNKSYVKGAEEIKEEVTEQKDKEEVESSNTEENGEDKGNENQV